MAPKRKCKFNEDWRSLDSKVADNGMAQCNLCAMDFSVSYGGRTDVRRHQESARHAKLAKSKGLYEGRDGPVAYVVHGQNEVDGVTSAETMFAYWITHHNLPTCRTRIGATLSTVLLSE